MLGPVREKDGNGGPRGRGQPVGAEGHGDLPSQKSHGDAAAGAAHEAIAHDAEQFPLLQHPEHLQDPTQVAGRIDETQRSGPLSVLKEMAVHIPLLPMDEDGGGRAEAGKAAHGHLPAPRMGHEQDQAPPLPQEGLEFLPPLQAPLQASRAEDSQHGPIHQHPPQGQAEPEEVQESAGGAAARKSTPQVGGRALPHRGPEERVPGRDGIQEPVGRPAPSETDQGIEDTVLEGGAQAPGRPEALPRLRHGRPGPRGRSSPHTPGRIRRSAWGPRVPRSPAPALGWPGPAGSCGHGRRRAWCPRSPSGPR